MSTNADFVTMRVWLPGAFPGLHPHLLTLENPNALMFFLEALAHGNAVFPAEQEFTIVAYQGVSSIGRGTYKRYFYDVGNPETWEVAEPVLLIVVAEQGEIIGVVQEAWGNVMKTMFAEEK